MVCWIIKHAVIETQNKKIFSIAHKSFLLLLSYQLNELLLHLENRSFGYALNRDKDYMGRNIMKTKRKGWLRHNIRLYEESRNGCSRCRKLVELEWDNPLWLTLMSTSWKINKNYCTLNTLHSTEMQLQKLKMYCCIHRFTTSFLSVTICIICT